MGGDLLVAGARRRRRAEAVVAAAARVHAAARIGAVRRPERREDPEAVCVLVCVAQHTGRIGRGAAEAGSAASGFGVGPNASGSGAELSRSPTSPSKDAT